MMTKAALFGCRFSLALTIATIAAHSASGAGLTYSVTNSASIRVNDTTNQLTTGRPYATGCVVSGLDGLSVSKTTITLNGFYHTFPSDVAMMLVGPQGQSALVMAETGGQNRYSVTNLTLTIDDDASGPLPILTSLYSGTFKPTDGYQSLGYQHLPYDFPAPVPTGNSNSPASFSVFKKTAPNGTWNLYMLADAAGSDYGIITNGWILNLTVAVPLQISIVQTNAILSWPASATNGILQSNSNLANSAGWSNITTTPVMVSGRLTVTNPIAPGKTFYRLVTY